MKTKSLIYPYFLLGAVLMFLSVYTFGQVSNETVTDIDGNVYHTVIIGTQTWMVEDLKVTRYSNGAPLDAKNYCWYNDNISSKDTYGALYSWYGTAMGPLAPKGWHVPSEQEWLVLIEYLGGENIAGGKLKETGYDHWTKPNTGADNSSGFNALPAGGKDYYRGFVGIGYNICWWSSKKINLLKARAFAVFYDSSKTSSIKGDILAFLPVRCIKD